MFEKKMYYLLEKTKLNYQQKRNKYQLKLIKKQKIEKNKTNKTR